MNTVINRETKIIDLGLIGYQKALEYQTGLFNEILAIKTENRSRETNPLPTPNYLIFCEHSPVFTLGKSGDEKNLLIKKGNLTSIHADYFTTNRGGDITFHGPGQIVVYPVIDLENFFTDIHRYMRTLEEAVIQTLQEFSLTAGRIEKLTGVWVEPDHESRARKICAMGVKMSRWVTLHGLAFNVNPDLSYFNYIIPCGIGDKAVTSMEKELGIKQNLDDVKKVLNKKLISLFNFQEQVVKSA